MVSHISNRITADAFKTVLRTNSVFKIMF